MFCATSICQVIFSSAAAFLLGTVAANHERIVQHGTMGLVIARTAVRYAVFLDGPQKGARGFNLLLCMTSERCRNAGKAAWRPGWVGEGLSLDLQMQDLRRANRRSILAGQNRTSLYCVVITLAYQRMPRRLFCFLCFSFFGSPGEPCSLLPWNVVASIICNNW